MNRYEWEEIRREASWLAVAFILASIIVGGLIGACVARADTLRAWTAGPFVTTVDFDIDGTIIQSNNVEILPDGSKQFSISLDLVEDYTFTARACRSQLDCSEWAEPMLVDEELNPPFITPIARPLIKAINSQDIARVKDYEGWPNDRRWSRWQGHPRGHGWWTDVGVGTILNTQGIPANERDIQIRALWSGCVAYRVQLQSIGPAMGRSPWSTPVYTGDCTGTAPKPIAVPEPSLGVLMGVGLMGLYTLNRRAKNP